MSLHFLFVLLLADGMNKQKLKAQLREDILFRTNVRAACLASLGANTNPYKRASQVQTVPDSPPKVIRRVKQCVSTINLTVPSDDSEDTMDYEVHNRKLGLPAVEAVATPIAVAYNNDEIPTVDRLCTLMASEQRCVSLEHGKCKSRTCKYCTGGLVQQREHLLARLIIIERLLFKDGT